MKIIMRAHSVDVKPITIGFMQPEASDNKRFKLVHTLRREWRELMHKVEHEVRHSGTAMRVIPSDIVHPGKLRELVRRSTQATEQDMLWAHGIILLVG